MCKRLYQSIGSPRNLILLTLLVAGLAYGCSKGEPPVASPPIVPVQNKPSLPTDFVICIDNSGSITPPERILIRETTMLFADLADSGDRISVITFGRGARAAASVLIQNDGDRSKFKQTVQAQVNFTENFSDIAAGIRLLASSNEGGELFRPAGQSKRAVILMSDGKLEPADQNTRAAFERIRADLAAPLTQTDIYAVVLGDTFSKDLILNVDGQALNGQGLMKIIARSEDHYFHARSLDQLLQVGVAILNKVKGIASIGEKGGTEYRIDDTVESMTLIVRKRSTDGTVLFQSPQIGLKWPGMRPESEPVRAQTAGLFEHPSTSIYWNSDYTYFDLIIVRRPQEGNWQIGLDQGEKLEVLSKIVTPIDLKFNAKEHYYLNEAATLTAWLFDRRTETISKDRYKIQAHLADQGDLAASNIHLPLRADAETGQFFLEVPAGLNAGLKRDGSAGSVTVELIAEKWKDEKGEALDPWFIRRSAPFTVKLVEPFVKWTTVGKEMKRIPTRSLRVGFGGEIDGAHPNRPAFEVPPALTVSVERLDDKTQTYQPYRKERLAGNPDQKNLVYLFEDKMGEAGRYRYHYRLEGTTKSGPFAMESLHYTVDVQLAWEYVAAAFLALTGLLFWISDHSAKLGGQVTEVSPEHSRVRSLVKRMEPIEHHGIEFELIAKQTFFVQKKIILKMVRGSAVVGGTKITTKGTKETELEPKRRHKMTFTGQVGSEEKEIEIEIKAFVRTF